jgi:hypothetical protein
MGENVFFEDNNGFQVRIGTVVAYTENFATEANGDNMYVVRDLPNWGDMVTMQLITDYQYNPDTREESYTVVETPSIQVKPFKVGAI